MKKIGLSRQAYDAIKDMIVTGELKPGQLLNESDMQERLLLGRTPIREAFLELARDQLVVIHPRKGIEISRISPKKIHDIFQIREILEPSLLSQGMANLDREWLKKTRQAFLQNEDLPSKAKQPGILECVRLDNQFHAALADCAGNDYVKTIMNGFLDYVTMIRIATTQDDTRYRASNQEHVGIIDAILAGDRRDACQKLLEHIRISHQATIDSYVNSSF